MASLTHKVVGMRSSLVSKVKGALGATLCRSFSPFPGRKAAVDVSLRVSRCNNRLILMAVYAAALA